MKILIYLFSLLPLSALAATGGSDRGGGNALVCFNSTAVPQAIRTKGNPDFGLLSKEALTKITTIEMLDLYQAKLADSAPNVVRAKPDADAYKLAANLMDRLNYVAPSIFNKLSDGREALKYSIYYSPEGLAIIDDVNLQYAFDREHCVIATMAAQDAGTGELFIDARLYRHAKHSVESQATMWLHEWAYYNLLRAGVRSSAGVRAVVARMLTDRSDVRTLLAVAANAGLLKTEREKLDGIQEFLFDYSASMKESLSAVLDSNWFTGSCEGTGESDRCASYLKSLNAKLNEDASYVGYRGWLVDADSYLQKQIEQETDPAKKWKEQGLLPILRQLVESYTKIGSVMSALSPPLSNIAPEGSPYGLQQQDIDEAIRDYLPFFKDALAESTFRNELRLVSTDGYRDIKEYQARLRPVRDALLKNMELRLSQSISVMPPLRLPNLKQ